MKTKLLSYIILLFAACMCAQPMTAQLQSANGKEMMHGRKRKFDKEKFRKEQEKFIASQAHLTEKEQMAFFPVFHKMQDEERELFIAHGKLRRTEAHSDKEAKALIKKMDNLDLQMKQLQMKYHSKFYDVLPATKVLACLKAEEQFKRQVMERMARGKRQNNKRPTHQKAK